MSDQLRFSVTRWCMQMSGEFGADEQARARAGASARLERFMGAEEAVIEILMDNLLRFQHKIPASLESEFEGKLKRQFPGIRDRVLAIAGHHNSIAVRWWAIKILVEFRDPGVVGPFVAVLQGSSHKKWELEALLREVGEGVSTADLMAVYRLQDSRYHEFEDGIGYHRSREGVISFANLRSLAAAELQRRGC